MSAIAAEQKVTRQAYQTRVPLFVYCTIVAEESSVKSLLLLRHWQQPRMAICPILEGISGNFTKLDDTLKDQSYRGTALLSYPRCDTHLICCSESFSFWVLPTMLNGEFFQSLESIET